MRKYKYQPEDFGALTVKVIHMNLKFDVYEEHTDVLLNMKVKTKENISKLELNAKRLDIHEVSCDICDCEYEYKKDESILLLKFSKNISEGTELTITTKTTCKPTKNILEGLYYDETPKGAPPTQITQCQQWGFQRIAPCIDDMTAKCTWTAEITADSNYTHIITNGNQIGKRENLDNGRVKVKYDNTLTPMPTYLFYLGCGTYDAHQLEFEYPNGDKFMLELLVAPGSSEKRAKQALEIMHDCVMWTYLFTGPEQYKNKQKSQEIWNLLKQKDKLEVREKIKTLAASMNLGYKYTGEVYREIAMQNSSFGGMENVGNTTITANRIMPYKEMTDASFEYMLRVKVHEYYHNLNGSEVTGWSPFEIWLNEAVTVMIERDYYAFVFGRDYSRLSTAVQLVMPHSGTLCMDENPSSLQIKPKGFNDANELITSVTYVKGPEFVRMIEQFMGKEKFVQGLYLFHTRYAHSNATTRQWVECMEEVSGLDFKSMSEQWLGQNGFPHIQINSSYSNGRLTLGINQEDVKQWEFPFLVAGFKDGEKLFEEQLHIKNPNHSFVIETEEPDFLSLNRGFSVFGKVDYEVSDEELFMQVSQDDDIVTRFLAYKKLMDREKLRLMKEDGDVKEKIIDMYYSLISDKELMNSVGSLFLYIFDSVEDSEYMSKYKDVWDAKQKILKAIAVKYEKEIKALYDEYSTHTESGSFIQNWIDSIKPRRVKNACLFLLSKLDTPKIHALIKKQFEQSDKPTDKIRAFQLYLDSSAPDWKEVMKTYEKEAKGNLVSWEAFLFCIGGNNSHNALEIIKEIETHPSFRVEQSNDMRALYLKFANNKKISLMTKEGREFLRDRIIKLAKVNEYNTTFLVKNFGTIDKLDSKTQIACVQVLVDILTALSEKETPSVYGTAKTILNANEIARKAYEKANGNIML